MECGDGEIGIDICRNSNFFVLDGGATANLMKSIRLSDVLELPVADRLKLVEAIWDSIAQAPQALDLTEAQRIELDRRLDEYERNPDAGSPWPEVRERILKRT